MQHYSLAHEKKLEEKYYMKIMEFDLLWWVLKQQEVKNKYIIKDSKSDHNFQGYSEE